MVSDYSALNNITIKDANPLPLVNKALDKVAAATVFSKIDLILAYNQIYIREVDCPKTEIRTVWIVRIDHHVLWETKSPAAFTNVINSTINYMIGKCLVILMNDVIICRNSHKGHGMFFYKFIRSTEKNIIYDKRSNYNITYLNSSF